MQREEDSLLDLSALPMTAGARSSAAVWHRFMRGPVVGNFLHDQMEWLAGEGFALAEPDDAEVSDPLSASLSPFEHSFAAPLRARRPQGPGRRCVAVAARRGAPAAAPLRVTLADLGAQDALLAEMEFWLPAQRLSAQRIDALCREHILPGQPRPVLPERELHGMLMGFADLVFCHAGRYWVLDYKTNHLGSEAAAYTHDALAGAMLEHRYDVQAALYLLALHRLLQSRLGDAYEPTQHLGGALYFSCAASMARPKACMCCQRRWHCCKRWMRCSEAVPNPYRRCCHEGAPQNRSADTGSVCRP